VNVFLPRRLRGTGLVATVPDYLRFLNAPAQVIEAPNINAPEMVARLREFAPGILWSFSATTRFKDALLEIPTRAALNVHYALLPQYAGISPYFWYLRNGERECGVTLHQMVTRLDAGPIIEQARFSVEQIHTVCGILRSQTACVSPMLTRFYDGVTSEHTTTPQDLAQRTYYRHPRRADVAALYRAGNRFYCRDDLTAIRAVAERLMAVSSGNGG